MELPGIALTGIALPGIGKNCFLVFFFFEIDLPGIALNCLAWSILESLCLKLFCLDMPCLQLPCLERSKVALPGFACLTFHEIPSS